MHRIAAALIALAVTQQEPAAPPAPAAPAAASPAEAPPPAAPPPPPAGAAAASPAPPPPAARAPAPAPALPSGAREPRPPPESRDLLLRAALEFTDALIRGDAVAIVAASAPRFSFDGALVEGREPQIRRWREILAARQPPIPETLRDLVLLTSEEALAQLGPPPARLAAWTRPGAWLAFADVSGRPVLLLLAPEGGRWAVAGMSD